MIDSESGSNARHIVSALTRAKSMRTQLSLAFSFCDLAQTAIAFGHVDEARSLIQKTRHSAETISVHIHEHGYVPSEEVGRLTEQLARLEARLANLEQKLAS